MDPNTTLLGVDYSRISDDDTGLHAGVDDQARQNLDLAERYSVTLVERFSDNSRSASKDLSKRSNFRAMLDRIKRGDVRYVIAWHPDRLLRNNGESVEFVRLCERHNVAVLTVTAGQFDLSTAWGRKSFFDAVNMASYESEHRGERVRAARARQAERGDYGGGVRPYGWGLVTDKIKRAQVAQRDDNGNVVRDDRGRVIREYVDVPHVDMTQHNSDEAAEIRRMARQILNGVSVSHVIRDLKSRDVPTVTGGSWGNRQIRAILTSPRVSGHAVHHGEIVQHDAWEPIISEDERQALITILSDPARKSSPGNKPRWLGSLIYQCGYCNDDTMTVRKRSDDGLSVYRCRSKGHGSRDAVALDQYVTDVLLGVIERDAADLIDKPSGVDVAALTAEREQLRGKLRDLTDAFLDDQITREQLSHATAKAQARIDGITAELSAQASTSPLSDFVGVDDVKAVWDSKSLGEHREILKIVLSVTVKPGTVRDVDPEHVEIKRA